MHVTIDGKLNKHIIWIEGNELISLTQENAYAGGEEEAQKAEEERIWNAAWKLLADGQPVNNETIARVLNEG